MREGQIHQHGQHLQFIRQEADQKQALLTPQIAAEANAAAQSDLTRARAATSEAQHALDNIGPRTEADLVQAAVESYLPGLDWCDKIFSADGKLYSQRRALWAAKIFDPFYLRTLSNERGVIEVCATCFCCCSCSCSYSCSYFCGAILQGKQRIDALTHFGFPEFTVEFLTEMKAQLCEAIKLANEPFDPDKFEGAAQYNEKLEAKKLARQRRLAVAVNVRVAVQFCVVGAVLCLSSLSSLYVVVVTFTSYLAGKLDSRAGWNNSFLVGTGCWRKVEAYLGVVACVPQH